MNSRLLKKIFPWGCRAGQIPPVLPQAEREFDRKAEFQAKRITNALLRNKLVKAIFERLLKMNLRTVKAYLLREQF